MTGSTESAPPPAGHSKAGARCCGGLLRRCEIWLPSPKGWLLLIALAAALVWLATKTLYPFLAVSNPYPDGPITVEGWVNGKGYAIISEQFQKHGSPLLFTTGGPIESDSLFGEYHNYAELGAAALKRQGFPAASIQEVPASPVIRDRTFASALALRHWMEEHHSLPAHLTVITAGPHARRTRLLFQKAFGDATKIGVQALTDDAYQPDHWWGSSEGFRNVTSELIAYVYARLFFWPKPQ